MTVTALSLPCFALTFTEPSGDTFVAPSAGLMLNASGATCVAATLSPGPAPALKPSPLPFEQPANTIAAVRAAARPTGVFRRPPAPRVVLHMSVPF